jgi:hypothetical protein
VRAVFKIKKKIMIMWTKFYEKETARLLVQEADLHRARLERGQ